MIGFQPANVTDKRTRLTRFTNISANNMNQVYIVPSQPRTFGIQVSQNSQGEGLDYGAVRSSSAPRFFLPLIREMHGGR